MINSNDGILFSRLNDLIFRVGKTERPAFSDFLNLKEQLLTKNQSKPKNINYKFFGGYKDAERKVLCVFSSYDEPENDDFPIVCLKIEISNKNNKLSHKDYMGSIMALGIERSVFGDILVDKSNAYIFILKSFENYFISNLENIGRESCKIEVMPPSFEPNAKTETEELQITVTSTRLDCVVSSLCKLSREKSLEYINAGKVSLNYFEIKDQAKKLAEGDVLTVRSYGKFIIGPEAGKTQKSKFRIKVIKYK